MIVIRHAWAGHSGEWEGDDRRRPVDERGREQSDRLVEELAGHEIERIISSPYDRCVQTVEPLARVRGLEIELHEDLERGAAGTRGRPARRVAKGQPVVLCVHGGLSEEFVGKHLKKGEWLEA